MDDICRLCLCYNPLEMHQLFEDSELISKLTQSFHFNLSREEFLPDQVCTSCIEIINQMYCFHKKVTENQIILCDHLKNGKDALNSYYLVIKNIKEDTKEVSLIEFEENFETNESYENGIIKNENYDYSSDDNITLSSIKRTKQRHYISKPSANKLKKRTKKLSLQIDSIEAKENIQTVKEEIDENPSIKSDEHKCLTCLKLCSSNKMLSKHYKVEHGPKIGLKIGDFIKQNGINNFTCSKCNKVFDNKKSAMKHGYYCCTEDRPFLCSLCGRTFKVVPEIIRHARAHGGVKIVCSYKCGYSTAYLSVLKEHEKRHRNEYKYKCQKCGKGFQVKTWYDEHQNIHTGAKPFVCDLCGLSYHLKRYLTKHRTISHPQSTDLKRFVCIHCTSPCDSKNALKEHLLRVHGITSFFLCDICGKTFAKSSHLSTHKEFHLGVKPHSCSTCSKSFTTKYHLKRHQLTHTGIRAHACSKCGKQYVQRYTLLQHNLRHHNAASHKCSKCEKVFTSISQLTLHYKRNCNELDVQK